MMSPETSNQEMLDPASAQTNEFSSFPLLSDNGQMNFEVSLVNIPVDQMRLIQNIKALISEVAFAPQFSIHLSSRFFVWSNRYPFTDWWTSWSGLLEIAFNCNNKWMLVFSVNIGERRVDASFGHWNVSNFQAEGKLSLKELYVVVLLAHIWCLYPDNALLIILIKH